MASSVHRRTTLLLRLSRATALQCALAYVLGNLCCIQVVRAAETTALWLFDEPRNSYPSSVLDSSLGHDAPLVLGPGGQLVAGKYGNALATRSPAGIEYPAGKPEFGLQSPIQLFKTRQQGMTWPNSHFSALMSDGQRHLRKEVGFVNAVETKLNLGDFDWTVEFWFQSSGSSDQDGTVFEMGLFSDKRSNKQFPAKTRLTLTADRRNFVLTNDPSQSQLKIPTNHSALHDDAWHHLAFVYAQANNQIAHYVDGQRQPKAEGGELRRLPDRPFSYLSFGRDGDWSQPLPGKIDELRFSTGQVYPGSFQPPASFAPVSPPLALQSGPTLLFEHGATKDSPIELGRRRHLFIDDALLAEVRDARFVVNPPKRAERVIDGIQGPFRKHLTVVEDSAQLIRIYNSVERDHLAVRVSTDGIEFAAPAKNGSSDAVKQSEPRRLVVIPEMVGGLGNPFIDPNGPDDQRWKYFSDYHRRGIYLYTSPDGYVWQRNRTATLPFRSGTQSCTYYDDQRQLYVSFHRSGIHHTPAGGTERSSAVTEHEDLSQPLPFAQITQREYLQQKSPQRLRDPLPWYLDNGPLTPGGFGLEFPHAFRPIEEDPPGTDIYVTKAQKYPWAPDTYLAFPIVYFHYWPDGPAARNVLATPQRGRGSGPIETQLSVSRDGRAWQRYARPAYVGIGRHGGRDVRTAYIAHGMVRRGDEIWQYYFGETQYHSAYTHDAAGRGVYRLVQRLDGFVSLDSPYDRESLVVTKPLTFDGNRLTLNIDTDATGYAQIGITDTMGRPFPGYSLDECVYINGDFIDAEVEWLEPGKDLRALNGKTVQLVLRMRGSKLYALQFSDR